ncbi:MAG: hypothetical protein ABFC77_04575 [Thermoguttaceae bacterium]
MFPWKKSVAAALGVGLVLGLALSGFWPQTPLHAVATDRSDSYAMATGPLDNEVEAVYFLDFLTGDLKVVVLGRQTTMWAGFFETNVSTALNVDPQKNPKYMMVTGVTNLRRAGGSRQQPSSSMCYVAEVTSGKVVAYAVPWSPAMYVANQMQKGPLVQVGVTSFRQGFGATGYAPAGGGRGR